MQDTELRCQNAPWGAVPTNLGKQEGITEIITKLLAKTQIQYESQ